METAYVQVYVISSRVLSWSIFRNIHIQMVSLQYVLCLPSYNSNNW